MTVKVSALNFYPVKSLAGISLGEAVLGPRGIKNDRDWMVVRGDGQFITQRQYPAMALIKTEVVGDGTLHLTAPDMEPHTVHSRIDGSFNPMKVTVWNDDCEAIDEGEEAATWLSEYLSIDCRLVRMTASFRREIDEDHRADGENIVGFADGFPLLIISAASLTDLNNRLDEPLLMNRFRPNIVVDGCEPFAEDRWKEISINGVKLSLVKRCDRCTITTVNQESGSRSKEPLKTLSEFRKEGDKVFFGQNAVHATQGKIRVGDAVQILN